MSDLPTRAEAIHEIMHPNGPHWDDCDKFWCRQYIPAFVNGELIHRKDIDYEAAGDAAADGFYNDQNPQEYARAIVDAALGIGDDDG